MCVCVCVFVYNNVISRLLICVHHMPRLSRLCLSGIYLEKDLINNSWLLPAVCKVAYLQDDISTKSGLLFILQAAPPAKTFSLGSNQWRQKWCLKSATLVRVSPEVNKISIFTAKLRQWEEFRAQRQPLGSTMISPMYSWFLWCFIIIYENGAKSLRLLFTFYQISFSLSLPA